MLLDPKNITIPTGEGAERTYIISKFPAVEGREIVTQYPLTAMPRVAEYQANETIMLKLMKYVGVPREGGDPLCLATRELVNNHVPDWETLARLEAAMMEYNCSFFRNGTLSTFFKGLVGRAGPKLTEMLTALSASSLRSASPTRTSKRATRSKTR